MPNQLVVIPLTAAVLKAVSKEHSHIEENFKQLKNKAFFPFCLPVCKASQYHAVNCIGLKDLSPLTLLL